MKRVTRRCVYCGESATTRDHVPAKRLLEEPLPPNLRTVPSCEGCNIAYGRDEEYLIAFLAHIGSTEALNAKVEEGGKVSKALDRPKARGFSEKIDSAVRLDDDGRPYIEADINAIARIVKKVAFGLHCTDYPRHRNRPKLDQFEVIAIEPITQCAKTLGMMMNTRFQPRRWQSLQPKVFSYMFLRNAIGTNRGDFICLMKFHETLAAAVKCPAGRREADHKLNREQE